MSTGFVFHEKYLWHNTGLQWLDVPAGSVIQPLLHPENPETKRRFKNLVDVSALAGGLTPVAPRMATHDELVRVHTRDYVERIERLSAHEGGDAGYGTPFGAGGADIARLSAGGVLAAAEAVMAGKVRNAYALVRPPGHHAKADTGFGFCVYNNVALAARHLQAAFGLKRIAIVDWDVHHGNGTQSIFYADPGVLTISIHQDNSYPPRSGAQTERGEGAGAGYNLNIPLPPGSGHGAYLAAFERVVAPALRRFKPDFILVASGLDGSYFDPLARMMAYSSTYRAMARTVREAAEAFCQGRLVAAHEGGYSEAYVPYCGLAILEEFSGLDSGVADPYLKTCQAAGMQDLQPHQAAAVAEAERLVGDIGT